MSNKTYYQQFWDYVNRGFYQQFIKDLKKTKSSEEIKKINLEIRLVYLEDFKRKFAGFLGTINLLADDSTIDIENNIFVSKLPTFTRLMVGNHGIYVEFGKPDDCGIFIKKRLQYDEYSLNGVKVYHQFKTVNYADYKIGKCYIDVFDWKDL